VFALTPIFYGNYLLGTVVIIALYVETVFHVPSLREG